MSPRVSIVIPSGDARRDGNLTLLLEDIRQQTCAPFEVEVVRGLSPNGHARNVGAAKTTGEYLVFLDDDIRLGSPDVLRILIAQLEANLRLGMVGTSQLLPPDSSLFQRRCAGQISRCQSEVVSVLTDSDMVTTQCCALRREVFDEVGGFHDRIIRGVDPELRHRIREAGYRVAVAPNAWHYHPMPADLRSLLRIAWRNGAASTFARRHYPETVLFNPEGHVAEFEARPSFAARILRKAQVFGADVFAGRFYGVLYTLAYLGGSLRG